MAASQALVLLFVSRLVALAASATINLAENGYGENWQSGHATWYGDPQGEGSSGGACGYTELTGDPIENKIAAGNAPIYQDGKGCSQCYDVKCAYPSCQSTPTRVVITDLCPGGTYRSTDQPAFDLSGAAISAMATDGQDGALRNIGLYDIQYKRMPCSYPSQNVALKVDAGSTNYWLSFAVKYLGGPGDIQSVQISQDGGGVVPASSAQLGRQLDADQLLRASFQRTVLGEDHCVVERALRHCHGSHSRELQSRSALREQRPIEVLISAHFATVETSTTA